MIIWAFANFLTFAQTQDVTVPKTQKVTVLKYAVPKYPVLARCARITGDVTVRFDVEKDGTVSNARVVSGSPILAQTSLDAIKAWKFQCLSCGFGKPFEHQFVFSFQISNKLVDRDYSVESKFPDRLTLSIAPVLVQPQKSEVTAAALATSDETMRLK